MKLQHFCIWFLIVMMPFSILARNTTHEYMLTLRDQVRLNGVIDNATQDAVEMLIELNDEFQTVSFGTEFNVTYNIASEAIKAFFQTLAINFNMPYVEGETELYFSMYVPAIVIVGYDGFFVYSVSESGDTFHPRLSPKIPYAYEDTTTDTIINFTLGNDIRIFINDQYYEGELTKNYTNDAYAEALQYRDAFGSNASLIKHLPDMTDDMSLVLDALRNFPVSGHVSIPDFLTVLPGETPMLQDTYRAGGDAVPASKFHAKRREVIINTIREVLQEEINSHSDYAAIMGSSYDFTLPEITNDDWTNSINDISVLSFIQGIPIGVNRYYNNYALGGSKIIATSYLYGNTVGGVKYYHDEACVDVQAYMNDPDTNPTNMDNMFVNRFDAAAQGYYPCNKCKP